MKYLLSFLRENKKKVTLSIILLLGQVVGTLLIPALIANVVDKGILQQNMDVIKGVGLQMLIVAVAATLISAWGSWATSDLAAHFGRSMRSKLLSKSQQLSIQQFNSVGISSMITRSTSDINNLQQALGMLLQMVAPAPIIIIVSVIMSAMVNPILAVVQMGFMIIMLILGWILLKKSTALSQGIQTKLDSINKVVRESITGVRVIRAFGNEQFEEKRSGKAYGDYADNVIKLNKLFAVFNPAVWVLMGTLMAVLLGIGGMFSVGGLMEVGQITAVIEYSTLTMAYLMMAATTLTMLPKAKASLVRLQEVLDIVPAVPDTATNKPSSVLAADSLVPTVEFQRVNFSYPGAEEPVIRELSFKMFPGQTTAFIGSTGSGKSTLTDLLLRMHDIQTGSIKLNGRSIKKFIQEELRERIGCVPQKAFLFSGTIAQNLRMGKKDATDDELWSALRIAQSDDFVRKLPDKLEAPVAQGGSNFSGGQRQRLSIARALVKDADIFVFDDSFSALDVKTDAALRKALHNEVKRPAKLIIAQRVSTIKDADQILVLDEGTVVGVGKHEELLENCAVYRAIAESQKTASA